MAKSKRIKDILSYLQEDVPSATPADEAAPPPPDEDEGDEEGISEPADINGIAALPDPLKKKKRTLA